MDKKYPQLICEYCGHKNQLDFEPKIKALYKLLFKVVCSECGWFAYWKHYYTEKGMKAMELDPYKQDYLRDFYSPKVLHSKGHKKAKSKSI